MTTGIAHDLSAKLQGRLADVLQCELGIIQHVLEPVEISEVMLEAAIMVVRTTAATLSGFAEDPRQIEDVFRAVTAGVIAHLQASEDAGVARAIAAHRRQP